MYLKSDLKILKMLCFFLTTFHLLSLKLKMVLIRPNKKNSGVFQVMGLKILGKVGTHFFFFK